MTPFHRNVTDGSWWAVPTDPIRMVELDHIDRKLIELLSADGRASNRWLARQVGVTESTVAARIRNLSARRVLTVRAVFDWERAGYDWTLFVAVSVEGRSPRDVALDLGGFELVQTTTVVFGSVDIWMTVIAQDRESVNRFLSEQVTGVEGVAGVRVNIAMEVLGWSWNLGVLPSKDAEPFELPADDLGLDEMGMAVARELMSDGRQSNREIGRKLGVSEGTVRSRIRVLEDSGLARITAQIDPNATGDIGSVLYVGINVDGPRAQSVAREIATFTEVMFVAVTAGHHGVFMAAAAPRREQLIDLVINRVRRIEGVRSTESWDGIRVTNQRSHWVRFIDK